MFTLALVLTFAAIAAPGIAADDIQDFIGEAERQACDERARSGEQPPCNEPTPFRPISGLQSYNSIDHYQPALEGERLETRFDLAPALHGGATIPRLQPGIQNVQTAQEEISATQHPPDEAEPEPVSDFIPPPNTGRTNFFIWGTLSGIVLLGTALPVLRKRAWRH